MKTITKRFGGVDRYIVFYRWDEWPGIGGDDEIIEMSPGRKVYLRRSNNSVIVVDDEEHGR